jgi:hypothetical protein
VGLLFSSALSDERAGLQLTVQLLLGLASAVTLGPKSSSTHGHILLSHLRLPQPGMPGSCIYIPQEQGDPVIPPVTGFPFCRLLLLAGLRWRYSNPPPHRSVAVYFLLHNIYKFSSYLPGNTIYLRSVARLSNH